MKSFKMFVESVDCASLLKARIKEKLSQADQADNYISRIKVASPEAQKKIADARDLIKAAMQVEAMHLRSLGKAGKWAGHPDCKGKVI